MTRRALGRLAAAERSEDHVAGWIVREHGSDQDWSTESAQGWSTGPARPPWQEVDTALREIARRRSALDADEARWLREAERLKIWRELGYVSMLDYLERVAGYQPRTALERMRVARALASLPQLEAAFAGGRSYSAIRELTRVATPATEAEWLAKTAGKTARELEEMVVGLKPGDRPGDRPDPAIVLRTLSYRVTPATYVRSREARVALDKELGRRLTDDEYEAARAEAVLERLASPRAKSGRARFQIALTVCKHCQQGWQHGAGAQVMVDRATVERAHCDGVHLGSLDDGPAARVTQTVPPRIVRFVWHRDGGRCQVPGCRSARNLELHHLEHRERGGGHDPSNICLACDSCHSAHHRGAIEIRGRAPDQIVVVRPNEPRTTSSSSGAAAPAIPSASGWAGDAGRQAETDRAAPDRRAGMSSAPVEPSGVATPADRADGVRCDAAEPSRGGAPGDMRRVAQPADRHDGVRSDAAEPIRIAAASEAATPSRFAKAAIRVQVRDALVGLGWKPGIARTAVDEAFVHVGDGAPLELLIREALRRCPKPRASPPE